MEETIIPVVESKNLSPSASYSRFIDSLQVVCPTIQWHQQELEDQHDPPIITDPMSKKSQCLVLSDPWSKAKHPKLTVGQAQIR